MTTDKKYPPIYPKGYFDRTEWDETTPEDSINKDGWSFVIYNPDGSITLTPHKPEVKKNIKIHCYILK